MENFNFEDIEELLSISLKQDTLNFNIFKELGVYNKEVPMCRALAFVLNYDKDNGRNKRLEAFFRMVLKLDEKEIEENMRYNTEILLEYPVRGSKNNRMRENDEIDPSTTESYADRRIDIVIKSKEKIYPIEVKINAGDQRGQCFDYVHSEINGDWTSVEQQILYYLTLDSHAPSVSSVKGLDCENNDILAQEKVGRNTYKFVKQISFANEILKWLDDCLSQECQPEFSMILNQLIDAIEKIANAREHKMNTEIKGKIVESPEKMAAAICIERNLNEVKKELMRKLFDEIQEKISARLSAQNLSEVIILPDRYYRYEDQIDTYYNQKESSFPGINYEIKLDDVAQKRLGKNRHLWIRIEIDWNLFVGIVVTEDKTLDVESTSINEQFDEVPTKTIAPVLEEMFDLKDLCKDDSWWLKDQYVILGDIRDYDVGEYFNFKTMNAHTISLCDDEIRGKVVDKTVEIMWSYVKLLGISVE